MKIVVTIYAILSRWSCPIYHALASLIRKSELARLHADCAPHVAVLGVLLEPVCAAGFAG
jgi:hypothetical protein